MERKPNNTPVEIQYSPDQVAMLSGLSVAAHGVQQNKVVAYALVAISTDGVLVCDHVRSGDEKGHTPHLLRGAILELLDRVREHWIAPPEGAPKPTLFTPDGATFG